ncbi:MAG: DUF2798 domain-containing protein [Hyphomicrobiaceae bacterium]
MSARYRLPHRVAPILFGALTSAFMSLLVSGVATWRALGLSDAFVGLWLRAWASAWPIAFAALLVVAPAVRRIVAVIVEPPPAASRRNGA